MYSSKVGHVLALVDVSPHVASQRSAFSVLFGSLHVSRNNISLRKVSKQHYPSIRMAVLRVSRAHDETVSLASSRQTPTIFVLQPFLMKFRPVL